MKKNSDNSKTQKQKSYLEIHIEEEGKVKFIPLTRNTARVVNALSDKVIRGLSVYCG